MVVGEAQSQPQANCMCVPSVAGVFPSQADCEGAGCPSSKPPPPPPRPRGGLQLATIFADDMVLQSESSTVHGTAPPGALVTLAATPARADFPLHTTASSNGSWVITMPPPASVARPHDFDRFVYRPAADRSQGVFVGRCLFVQRVRLLVLPLLCVVVRGRATTCTDTAYPACAQAKQHGEARIVHFGERECDRVCDCAERIAPAAATPGRHSEVRSQHSTHEKRPCMPVAGC